VTDLALIWVYCFPTTGKSVLREAYEEAGFRVVDTDDVLLSLVGSLDQERQAPFWASDDASKRAAKSTVEAAEKEQADVVVTNLHSIFPELGIQPDFAFVRPAADAYAISQERGGYDISEETFADWTEDDTFKTIRQNVKKEPRILKKDEYALDYVEIPSEEETEVTQE